MTADEIMSQLDGEIPPPEQLADMVMGIDPEVRMLDQLRGLIASDIKLKDLEQDPKAFVSKMIKGKKKFSPKEMEVMFEAHGKPASFDNEVLQGYVDNIKNYKYNYIEEAKKLDPSIDTSVQHIGPMAQDIEEVNPAAIITDKETGYKSVDTGRLALMNAGAIAELAKEVMELKNGGRKD